MSVDLEQYTIKAREKIQEYASRAIAILQEQVSTAKSSAKIAKLNSRIEQWKKSLEILNTDGTKEESKSE